MSTDAATLRQIARRTAGKDDNFVRLMENILDRLDAAEEDIETNASDIEGFISSAFLAQGTIFRNASTDALEPPQSPEVAIATGEGIAIETTTIGAETFTAFALEPGTFLIRCEAEASSLTWDIRHAAAFPDAVGDWDSDGTDIGYNPGSVNSNIAVALTTTTAQKLWAVASAASGHIHQEVKRLA